jgi:hypothetical protein
MFLVYPNGTKRTVSYPKWLMEQKLGRRLDPRNETVDHIDGDFNNNSLENLRIIPIREHVLDDVKRRKIDLLKCRWCGKTFEAFSGRRKRSKVGPFCSKHCSGKYGKANQMNGSPILTGNNIPSTGVYYKNKDLTQAT